LRVKEIQRRQLRVELDVANVGEEVSQVQQGFDTNNWNRQTTSQWMKAITYDLRRVA
jgi:hypothetical protein